MHARQARLDSQGTLLHHVIVRGIEKWDMANGKYDRGNVVLRLGELAEETMRKSGQVCSWLTLKNVISLHMVNH